MHSTTLQFKASPSSWPSAYPSDTPSVMPTEISSVIGGPWSVTIEQEVTIPTTCNLSNLNAEVCFSMDASGSFENELDQLKDQARNIFDAVSAVTESVVFGVTAFTDYPDDTHGVIGIDYPYKKFTSTMTGDIDEFDLAISSIPLGDGKDFDYPEANFDGIVGAAQGLSNAYVQEDDCGWSTGDPSIQRIMIVFADWAFHLPGKLKPHQNSFDDAVDSLRANEIQVIGLEVSSAANELDAIALATGGSVQQLDVNAANIVNAILAGFDEISCTLEYEAIGCDPLEVTFDPEGPLVNPGSLATIDITFSTDDRAALSGQTFTCDVVFRANGEVILTQSYSITVG